MPCYHPIRLNYKGVKDNGKDYYTFDWFPGYHQRVEDLNSPKDVLVPCRKCIGCRLDYSRKWADRIMLELDHSKTAVYLTLTYDDDHLTLGDYSNELGHWWFSLNKRDVQLFNKRLRQSFPEKKIRFFLSGEYGDSTLRPHYHGIYFGLALSDFADLQFYKLNKHGQPLYKSDKLSQIWSNGFVTIGNVSWQSCAYVARYNLKKLANGNDGSAQSRGCLPEFSLMSRNPGIAGYFHLDHPEIFDNFSDKIPISDPHGLRPVNLVNMPKYIFDKLELINPDLYAKIKEERMVNSTENFLLELSKTDLDEFDYQKLKESLHEKRVSSLKRSL